MSFFTLTEKFHFTLPSSIPKVILLLHWTILTIRSTSPRHVLRVSWVSNISMDNEKQVHVLHPSASGWLLCLANPLPPIFSLMFNHVWSVTPRPCLAPPVALYAAAPSFLSQYSRIVFSDRESLCFFYALWWQNWFSSVLNKDWQEHVEKTWPLLAIRYTWLWKVQYKLQFVIVLVKPIKPAFSWKASVCETEGQRQISDLGANMHLLSSWK